MQKEHLSAVSWNLGNSTTQETLQHPIHPLHLRVSTYLQAMYCIAFAISLITIIYNMVRDSKQYSPASCQRATVLGQAFSKPHI